MILIEILFLSYYRLPMKFYIQKYLLYVKIIYTESMKDVKFIRYYAFKE